MGEFIVDIGLFNESTHSGSNPVSCLIKAWQIPGF